MAYGAPSKIHTGDIEKFYPSSPHTLIITAFNYYNATRRRELQLLKQLLKYNYLTDGKDFYHLGTKGIPMGLPLTPELARMCTAYLLKDYEPPIGQALTLYFDDVAATYRINTLPLKPYNLLPTIDNTNAGRNIRYHQKGIFTLFFFTQQKYLFTQQKYRQAVPLHPHSFHPSTKLAKKTYFGAAFRATQIAHNPAEALDYMLRKYLPALQRLGHDCTEVVENMVRITYFPKRTEKKDTKYTPSIKYQFSDTRPTKSQLQPFQNKEYKLQPINQCHRY